MPSQPAHIVHLEPQHRGLGEWTPRRIRLAEQLADSGYLREAADLCEALLSDERIKVEIGKRANRLLGKKLELEPGRTNKRSKAVRFLEAEEDYYEIAPEAAQRQVLAWGWIMNCGLAQLPWQKKPGSSRVIPTIEPWSARHLNYDMQARKWLVTVGDGSTQVEIHPGDGKWLLHCPDGPNRPWTRGLWRGLARWWLLKQLAIMDWGTVSETIAVRVITQINTNAGSTKEIRRELAQQLSAMGREGVIALPPGFDLKIVELTADTWEIYKAQIEMADKAITIGIAGSDLNTDASGGGSYAAAKSQSSGSDECLRYDNEAWSTTQHDQIFVHWAEVNLGNAAAAPWPSREIDPPEDKAAKANTLKTTAEALQTLAQAPPEVDRRKIMEEAGIPLLSGVQTPPQTPQPTPSPAQTPPDVANNGTDLPLQEGLSVTLASGDQISATAGFVRGQAYVDNLVTEATDAAANAMADGVKRALSLIDNAKDAAQLERDLKELHGSLEEGPLAEVVRKALILGALRGQFSVIEDL